MNILCWSYGLQDSVEGFCENLKTKCRPEDLLSDELVKYYALAVVSGAPIDGSGGRVTLIGRISD
jgi:hypothetical protein